MSVDEVVDDQGGSARNITVIANRDYGVFERGGLGGR